MENLTVVARKERLSKLSAIRLERFHLRYAAYRPKGSFEKTSEIGVSRLSRSFGSHNLTLYLFQHWLGPQVGGAKNLVQAFHYDTHSEVLKGLPILYNPEFPGATRGLSFALSSSMMHQKWRKLAHKSPYPIATSRSAVQFKSTFCVGSAPQESCLLTCRDEPNGNFGSDEQRTMPYQTGK
jgi:hypothetical protein